MSRLLFTQKCPVRVRQSPWHGTKKKNQFASHPKPLLHRQGMKSRIANILRLVSLYCSHTSSVPDMIRGAEHSFVPPPCPHSSKQRIWELQNSSEETETKKYYKIYIRFRDNHWHAGHLIGRGAVLSVAALEVHGLAGLKALGIKICHKGDLPLKISRGCSDRRLWYTSVCIQTVDTVFKQSILLLTHYFLLLICCPEPTIKLLSHQPKRFLKYFLSIGVLVRNCYLELYSWFKWK